MRKFLCLLMIFSSASLFGQDAASALKAARELSGAVKSGDMMWMVESMYPSVRKTAAMRLKGGDAELVSKYRKQGADFKKSGAVIETFEVSDPVFTWTVRGGREYIVILPIRYVMAIKDPNGKLIKAEKKSFLYAVSKINPTDPAEKGRWYFIEGTTYTVNEMRVFFHDLPQNIKLPIVSERILPN